jgi:ribosome-associated protein
MPAREADPDFDQTGRPSKSQRKRDSHALQGLGEAVAALPLARLRAVELPEGLRDAIAEYQRTRSHEGRRRQMQYIGKLMRSVDAAPLEEAVAAHRLGGARASLALHEAERWRAELLADDTALTRWVAEHPQDDVQRLRALVRSARDEARTDAAPGAAVRQGRAFRDLFRHVRETLAA